MGGLVGRQLLCKEELRRLTSGALNHTVSSAPAWLWLIRLCCSKLSPLRHGTGSYEAVTQPVIIFGLKCGRKLISFIYIDKKFLCFTRSKAVCIQGECNHGRLNWEASGGRELHLPLVRWNEGTRVRRQSNLAVLSDWMCCRKRQKPRKVCAGQQ